MDYTQFKLNIYQISNIDLNCYKERQMKRRIDTFIEKNNYKEYGDFLQALRRERLLYDEFMSYITINVSEFFRNPKQWDVLRDVCTPVFLSKDRIRIWSCACSTGEEPYSLAMLLAENFPLQDVKIIATDLDKQVLDVARQGIYSRKDMLSVPAKSTNKYFTDIGNDKFKISESIKKCIQFKKLNLLEDRYPKNIDLILCRNVIIYFTEKAKNELYQKMNDSLNENGILFVGCTEQIVDCRKFGYDLIQSFFYKKKE